MTTRLLVLIPAGLATAVAVTQMSCALGGSLTPWKGGGFGMFSSVDRPELRALNVVALSPSESFTIKVPATGRGLPGGVTLAQLTEVRMHPTYRGLADIATAILLARVAPEARSADEPNYRLLHSRYSSVATHEPTAHRILEIVTSGQTMEDAFGVQAIEVNVLGVAFAGDRDSIMLTTVGPSVTAVRLSDGSIATHENRRAE
jgi:hypothetical protein